MWPKVWYDSTDAYNFSSAITDRPIDRQKYEMTKRQKDRQKDRQTDRHTHRQTDR